MKNRPFKTFLLEGEFHTDGDYHLDLDNWEFKADGFDKFFLRHEKWEETYYFEMQADNIYKVRDFLENLIVIYRVGRGHYWILKELYEMTKKVLDVVFNDNESDVLESIGGNYDGTYIGLHKFV